jgi:hypothetical protein
MSRTLNMVLHTVHRRMALSTAQCSNLRKQRRCLLRTIIRTMLLKLTSSRSTAHNSPRSNFPSNRLLTVTVCHLSSRHMVARHSSGQVHLIRALRSSEVVVAVASMALVVATRPLLWALQFAWDLTIKSETIWLKRAVASLRSMQIRVPLLHSLSLHIKAIRRKTFLSVRRLTPTALALIGVEEA